MPAKDDLDTVIQLTEKELNEICKQSAEAALHNFLPILGIDPNEPFEMQRDFQHLRRWRQATEGATKLTFRTVLTVLVAGAIGALWLGFKINVGK